MNRSEKILEEIAVVWGRRQELEARAQRHVQRESNLKRYLFAIAIAATASMFAPAAGGVAAAENRMGNSKILGIMARMLKLERRVDALEMLVGALRLEKGVESAGRLPPVKAKPLISSEKEAAPVISLKKATPPAGVGANSWRIERGELVSDAVRRFAKKAGWQIAAAPSDVTWRIEFTSEFQGSFEGALNWLSAGYQHEKPRPRFELYSNRVLKMVKG